MKNLLVLAVLSVGLVSCQSKKGFTVKGTVKNVKEGKIYLVNLHADTKDTLDIKNGKFSLSGVADEPTPFLIFSGDVLQEQTLFFVDQGTTTIEFTANDPSSVKIKGCKTHNEYSDFTAVTKPILLQFDSVQQAAMTGKLEQEEMQKAAMTIQENFESANLDFIKKNPGSYVSALLTYEYFRLKPKLNVAEKKKLLGQLDPKIQESHYGSKMLELISAAEATAIGKPAPAFSLPNEKGKEISLSSLKGKYVLIDFWASWCAPCRAENPNVVGAYNKYKKKEFYRSRRIA